MRMEIAVGQARSVERPSNVNPGENPVRQFVTRGQGRHAAEETVTAVVAGMNDFHRAHGLLSDEFSSL